MNYIRIRYSLILKSIIMFSLFKSDPTKKLNKQYSAKLEQAMHAQRNGDIRTYSMLTEQAQIIRDKIIELEKSNQ